MALRQLADQVMKERPNAIVAVGSGGIVVSGIIAKLLALGDVRIISVRKYSDEKPARQIEKEPVIVNDNSGELTGKRILVVDDFSSTGETLQTVADHLRAKGASRVITCSLVARNHSEKPDYYAFLTDGCVIFPWEDRTP